MGVSNATLTLRFSSAQKAHNHIISYAILCRGRVSFNIKINKMSAFGFIFFILMVKVWHFFIYKWEVLTLKNEFFRSHLLKM